MMKLHIISDLSIATPSTALSDQPVTDRWLILPYEAEGFSGKMLWSPVRNQPPEISIPLPDLGLCRIHIGMYGSATWPVWMNLLGQNDVSKDYMRVHLRLSDDDHFDVMSPERFENQPRFSHISDAYWKTADVSGKSLVLEKPGKEAYLECSPIIAYVRLVPTDAEENFPNSTKRLVSYFDSNFHGHYVDSAAEVKAHLAPLRDGDFDTVFWTTCREDTCYYPTKIGNRLSDIGTRVGVYPYWAGRDMKRMLDRGEDPLKVVCDVGHEYGLKVFSSYRRMTCRMPPFTFPLHPNALLMKRRDLWCADQKGAPVPHLSLTFPEVRKLMVSLLSEQAENYDIDGVHLFFTRGVPFVYFERPFVEAFQNEHGIDPRELPFDDQRVWKLRARFFLQFLRELKTSLSTIGEPKRRSFAVAMHVMNRVQTCRYYGLDIETMVRERLVDMLIPDQGHFASNLFGEPLCLPEFLAEFVAIAKGSGVRITPICNGGYWKDGLTIAQRAAAYYKAGADGLEVPMHSAIINFKSKYEVRRRLGHVDSLDQADEWAKRASSMVKVRTVSGLPIDMQTGIPTVG